MSEIAVVGHTLKNFKFRSLTSNVDKSTGEVKIDRDLNVPEKHIDKVTLLYYVEIDDKGNCVSYKPIIPANNYLIHLKVNKELEDTSHITNGLIHYFSKLLDWNTKWDHFPYRESSRPTYKFKSFLEDAAKSKTPNTKLASSTAKNYMSAVKNMYQHYMSVGLKFDNPPMQHEMVKVDVKSPSFSMNNTWRISVQSTDLRLKVPRVSNEDRERPLKSLADDEWCQVHSLITNKRKILKNIGNKTYQEASIPIEYSYMCMLMRWAGLRREEAATIRETHIRMPTDKEIEIGEVKIGIGADSYVDTKGDNPRTIIIPALLVRELFRYTTTERYIKRRDKFKTLHFDEPPLLFMKSNGKQYNNNTLNCRWSEIRTTIQKDNIEFKHKQHNLRATYAVNRLKAYLNAGYRQGDAITKLMKEMGHIDSATTDSYLRQATGSKSADHLSELVTEHLFDYYDSDFKVI
ncbi:site-specific integrase [Shewanella sp. 10N.286.48.B5]|uniref:site-specific integrase n=1 Tax=Shewanella sp. 10N.286.48.B5 TaxID=1880834 RepID=UPI000C85736A|nr:site-specific integrase [Shewanella sp. 10N.286.48.B5]PMH87011.1 hypothetical protein BCU57_08430 [Shewanella sp. 10N.286.48.B5]